MTDDSNTPERIDDLIALAALGELTDEEARELDAAAVSDPGVATELADALTAAASVQQLVSEEPPLELRSAVLAAIAGTPQDIVVQDVAVQDDPVPTVSAPIAIDRARSRRSIGVLAAAAAVVAVFAVGAVMVVSDGDDGSGDIAVVVDASDASTSVLTGEVEVLVTYAPSVAAVVVEAESLPVLDESATYQLWLLDADEATSVGIFRPDDNGEVSARFDDVGSSGAVFAVTREPAGGSDSPTLPILASS